MSNVKLISESIVDVEFVTEEKENGKKTYRIEGVFMQGDIKNRNGPFYFRIKRITAQLKLGLHVAKMLKRKSSMRFINISSDDFME